MWLTKFRLKLFLAHLFVSLLLTCLLQSFKMTRVWYPSPLEKATGVTSLFLMMLIVDVLLGPSLTLIVAEQGKKHLKLDLIIIFYTDICSKLWSI